MYFVSLKTSPNLFRVQLFPSHRNYWWNSLTTFIYTLTPFRPFRIILISSFSVRFLFVTTNTVVACEVNWISRIVLGKPLQSRYLFIFIVAWLAVKTIQNVKNYLRWHHMNRKNWNKNWRFIYFIIFIYNLFFLLF